MNRYNKVHEKREGKGHEVLEHLAGKESKEGCGKKAGGHKGRAATIVKKIAGKR